MMFVLKIVPNDVLLWTLQPSRIRASTFMQLPPSRPTYVHAFPYTYVYGYCTRILVFWFKTLHPCVFLFVLQIFILPIALFFYILIFIPCSFCGVIIFIFLQPFSTLTNGFSHCIFVRGTLIFADFFIVLTFFSPSSSFVFSSYLT